MPNEKRDSFKEFFSQCIVTDVGSRIGTTVLYAAYRAWVRDAGLQELSHKAFALQLKGLGFGSKKSDIRYWLDLALSPAGVAYAAAGQSLILKKPRLAGAKNALPSPAAPARAKPLLRRWWSIGEQLGALAASVLSRIA